MTLTRYTYNGPPSCVSLRVGPANELLDAQLMPGKPVELPAEHEYTLTMVAQKRLVLEPETEPAHPPVIHTPAATPTLDKKGAKT